MYWARILIPIKQTFSSFSHIKNLKTWKKYELQKTMKSILPQNCHFVMKNQHCRKYCHFQNFFAKKLPLIRQRSAIFSVKHLATLLPFGESQYHHLSFSVRLKCFLYTCSVCFFVRVNVNLREIKIVIHATSGLSVNKDL